MTNYQAIKESDLNEAMSRNSQEGLLMMMANVNLVDAELKVEGKRKHKIKTYKEGWYITVNTSKGIVGLWSCWLGDRLVLCFPKDIKIEYKDIIDILDLKLVCDTDYPKDKRLWGKYCSSRLEGDKGRIWVDYKDFDSNSHDFSYITEDKKLKSIYYGHHESNVISTAPFSFYSNEEKDAPNADSKEVIKYRDKFIELLLYVSKQVGDIKSIAIQYQTPVYIPEELETEGFNNIEWLKGSKGYREGWGNELVYATKNDEEYIFESANSLVPWVCTRQINGSDFTTDDIISLLTI